MTTTEFYYLLLVLGAFGSFAVGMVTATLQHKAWLRQQDQGAAVQLARPEASAKPVLARAA